MKCVWDGDCCKFRADNWDCSAETEKWAECAMLRIESDNAVCICGCPNEDHDRIDEGEYCENDENHECVRVCHAALQIVNTLRAERDKASRLCSHCEDSL